MDKTNELWLKEVSSAAEFLSLAKELSEKSCLWFRGLTDSRFELVPSAFRKACGELDEEALINDFSIYSTPFLKTVPKNGFEWLSLMQHHGLPTRILDWSESCLIALFFALYEWNPDSDTTPCVWILRPEDLNRLVTNEATTYIPTTEFLVPWLPQSLREYPMPKSDQEASEPGKAPVSIYLSHAHERIASQRGAFTLHGSYRECLTKFSLEKDASDLLRCVTIKVVSLHEKNQILKELDLAGLNYFTLYSGLDGLSRHLKWDQLKS